MNKVRTVLFLAALLSARVGFAADADDFGRGNMHFDVAEMDANHDGMITKDEFMAYGATMWGRMTGGKDTITVADAGKAFANGNMAFSAKKMDADKDGTISKDEFMKYGEAMWNKQAKDANGMIAVSDAAKDFSRGNMHPK